MKKDPLADKVKVRAEDFHKARATWNALYNHGQYSPHYFDTFIGDHFLQIFYLNNAENGLIFLSQRAADKVAMLCSPHARTLMQAFIIRTGYHKKLPK